jgi:hypothetical protein
MYSCFELRRPMSQIGSINIQGLHATRKIIVQLALAIVSLFIMNPELYMFKFELLVIVFGALEEPRKLYQTSYVPRSLVTI